VHVAVDGGGPNAGRLELIGHELGMLDRASKRDRCQAGRMAEVVVDGVAQEAWLRHPV
jgi:hypothetical protein